MHRACALSRNHCLQRLRAAAGRHARCRCAHGQCRFARSCSRGFSRGTPRPGLCRGREHPDRVSGRAVESGSVACSRRNELVRLKVDAIVVGNERSARVAKQASASVPIVASLYNYDPVAGGLIDSFARSGGNLTGLFTRTTELAGKRLEQLKEIIPNLSRLAVFWDPLGKGELDELQSAARDGHSASAHGAPAAVRLRRRLQDREAKQGRRRSDHRHQRVLCGKCLTRCAGARERDAREQFIWRLHAGAWLDLLRH